jgi:radical SAM protein with 4Fe4S-binding SPASM domain
MKLKRNLHERKRNDGVPGPGLFSYTRQQNGDRSHLHLRVENDGAGLLLINASRAVHLNPTAALMVWMLLEGKNEAEILSNLKKQYRVKPRRARQDLIETRHQLEELIRPDGSCPIHDLDLEILPPLSQTPFAPYRMDLALTYRCNNDCSHCYNARSRSFPELETGDWKRILEMLWEIGIPHICFTGGEATLRKDLPELIEYAGKLGQITGLLTNGRRLSDTDYLQSLLDSGLDHVQITLESHDPEIHDDMVQSHGAWNQTVRGIENVLKSNLYVMTNTTLLKANADRFEKTIDFLADVGVPTIGCNALIYAGAGKTVGTGLPEKDLEPLLQKIRLKTNQNHQRLIWYTPTQYCHFDPVQFELGVKACTAAMYNMCIEPNGDVIPCQSFYHSVGNILKDPWDSIWNHELSLWLRERKYVPETCQKCPVLQECGGGCPLTMLEQAPIEDFSSNALQSR